MRVEQISAALFCRIGRAVFGFADGTWQERMAAELGIAERKVRRMAFGQVSIPESLRDDLARLIEGHGDDLDGLLTELKSDGL
jgi:hypothetical protein